MITTQALTKRYKNHLAVDNLNLNVRSGEIYGFLGPNGAGKTTTIHMLLILDEPVSGLDPHGIRQVRELIHDYHQRGGTVFISSHILSEIERSADRIGILHQGRLLVEDTLVGLRGRLTRNQKCVIEL